MGRNLEVCNIEETCLKLQNIELYMCQLLAIAQQLLSKQNKSLTSKHIVNNFRIL